MLAAIFLPPWTKKVIFQYVFQKFVRGIKLFIIMIWYAVATFQKFVRGIKLFIVEKEFFCVDYTAVIIFLNPISLEFMCEE